MLELKTTRVGIEVEPGMIFTYLTFLTKFQQSFQSTCPFKLSTVKSIKKTFVSRETNKINCYKVLQAQLLILFFLMNSNARVKILFFFCSTMEVKKSKKSNFAANNLSLNNLFGKEFTLSKLIFRRTIFRRRIFVRRLNHKYIKISSRARENDVWAQLRRKRRLASLKWLVLICRPLKIGIIEEIADFAHMAILICFLR